MDPIGTLMEQHRAIERVAQALDAYAEAVRAGRVLGRQELGVFVRWLRGYVDELHRAREEALLVPRLAPDVEGQAALVQALSAEHADSRALVWRLRDLAAVPAPWTGADRIEAHRVASGWIALERRHMAREDEAFYPLAERTLQPAAREALQDDFAAELEIQAAREREFDALAEQLEGRWVFGLRPSDDDDLPDASSACGTCRSCG